MNYSPQLAALWFVMKEMLCDVLRPYQKETPKVMFNACPVNPVSHAYVRTILNRGCGEMEK